MTGVSRRIAGLLHRAQGDGLDDSGFISALGHFQELLEVCRLDRFRIGHEQVEARQDSAHHVQPFRFGKFVDTVDRRVLAVPKIAGDGFIGNEHAFFDDLFSNGPFPFFQTQRHAFRVEDDFIFREIEVDSPAAEAHVLEDCRQSPQFVEHRHKGLQVIGHDAVKESFANFDVVTAPFDADDSRADVGLEDLAFFIDFHDASHGVTVFVGIEAADTVRQDRRQHGNDPVDEVDAGAAVIRFLVDGRARADVVTDVRDVDTQAEMAIRQADDVDGIVQVLGIFTINGDELAVAVIAAPFFQGDRHIDVGSFLLDVVRKVERQAVAGHDDLDIQVLVAVIAEDFRHFPFGFASFFRPLGNLDQDAGTAAGAACLIEGDVYVFADSFVVRRDEGAVFFQLERTD